MKRVLFGVMLSLCAPCNQAAEGVRRVEFNKETTRHQWTLEDLDPALPSDWSPYDFLTFDFTASSPLCFEVSLVTHTGTRRVRVFPFQGARVRVSIPLAMFQRPPAAGFDLASVANQSRPSSLLNPRGEYGPIDDVRSLVISMNQPIGTPTLQFGGLRLTKGAPEDAVLDPKPLVDEFGQWIHDEWPGKAHSLAELKQAWATEERELRPGDFGAGGYGGFARTQARATGFFRAEQVDGRWWLVDPEGHLFFSIGVAGMRTRVTTRTTGRDGVFAALPPVEGDRKKPAAAVSFTQWNLRRRFGDDFYPAWADFELRRMEAWGLNTIGNWSEPQVYDAHRKPYVLQLRDLGIEQASLGLPDIYADDFSQRIDRAMAKQCAPRRDDPWLVGYFLANEPPWPLRELQLAEMVLNGPETPMQRELRAFLAQEGGDAPARRKQFVFRTFERFLAICNEALRRHDPNHLNLGLRFGGPPLPDEVLHVCRSLDVCSMNIYAYAPDPAYVTRIAKLTGRPILIGEFGFGTPGRGLTVGLRQAANHAERGVACRYYLEQAAAQPAIVGAHWFEWYDEPNTGRPDGEDFNMGILDVTGQPYPDMVEAFKASQRRLLPVHSGTEPPTDRQAKLQ